MKYWHPKTIPENCTCKLCAAYENNPQFRALADTVPGLKDGRPVLTGQSILRRKPTQKIELRTACIHEGKTTSECPRGEEKWHVRQCSIHGYCVRESGRMVSAHLCATCNEYRAKEDARQPVPSGGIVFDETNLHPGIPGKRFNSSIIEWGDGYAMAWRHGWAGSEIYISMLDSEFRPQGEPAKLNLFHPRHANYGREDPRFFRHNGQLHLEYIGVIGKMGPTNVLYARLNTQWQVEAIFYPEIEGRNSWEKNHQYFSSGGQLHAVYSVRPHRILRIDGNHAEWIFETDAQLPWKPDTEIRGGVSPVLVDDEWWCFFHAKKGWHYHMGLYTFENKPPFRVRRIIPEPLLWADESTNRGTKLHGRNYAPVVFPCGALLKGVEWIVSMGIHDRWTELHMFNHTQLARQLVPVGKRALYLPAGEVANRDVILAAFLTQSPDPFHGGKKVGKDVEVKDLSLDDKREYLRPFFSNFQRFADLQGCLIHDGGLEQLEIVGKSIVCEKGYPAFEQRWFLIRDWLFDHPEVRWLWHIDTNDVVFVTHPFDWLKQHVKPGQLAVGEELLPYKVEGKFSQWFVDKWEAIPRDYSDRIKERYADEYPPNCGTWGGRREDVLPVLERMCDHIELMDRHLRQRNHNEPIVLDMSAFAAALDELPNGSQVRFRIDGKTAINGVTSPLIHDRADALKFLSSIVHLAAEVSGDRSR
jgi:predicted GH43/DUF377 family glycosyl hydrolase